MAPILKIIECANNATICISSMTIISLITFVVIPFSIYITYQFYHLRQDQAIIRRYPSTLLLSSVLSIIYIFIVIQYRLIDRGISHRFHLEIEPIISRPYFILIILLNIFRIWLIIYDTNESVIIARHTWQSLLSSTANDKEWYSLNRRTWGNWKYLTKIFAVLWMLLSALCIIPFLLTHKLSADIAYGLILIALLSFSIFIWSKILMPCFQDTFFILKEIKILMIASIICFVIWCSLLYWVEHSAILALIQIFILFTFVFLQIFVSEFVVIQWLYKINPHSMKTQKLKINNSVKIITYTLFKAILSSDVGTEQYMKHLQHECTTENGLFFLEMIQWIYATTKQEWDRFDISPFSADRIHFVFAKIIPVSSINRDEETDWFQKIESIYTKYVHTSAEYQVNLPYCIVQEYIQLLRLYKMKKDIESGTYIAKFNKKKMKQPTLPRKSSTSFWSMTRGISSRNRKNNIDNKIKIDLKAEPITAAKSADAAGNMNTPNISDMIAKRIPSIIIEEKNVNEARQTTVSTVTNNEIRQNTIRSNDTKTKRVKFADLDLDESDNITTKAEVVPQTTLELDTIFTGVLVAPSADSEMTSLDMKFDDDDTESRSPLVIGNTERNLEQFLEVILNQLSMDADDDISADKKDAETALDIGEMDRFTNRSTFRSEDATPKPKPIEMGLDINMTTLSKKRDTLRTPDIGYNSNMSTPTFDYNNDYNVKKNLSIANRSPIPNIGKRFTRAISVAFSEKKFTQRSTTMRKTLAQFVNDNDAKNQYVLDEDDAKQMETAKSINLGHFIAISCFALNEVLMLNFQSVSRFKRSQYFRVFNENVNLEELLSSTSVLSHVNSAS